MDWITLLVEAAGAVIFVVWAVVPVREFREIYRRIRARDAAGREGEAELERVGERVGRDDG